MKMQHDLDLASIWDLGGHWGFLTGDLEEGFFFDIIDHVARWLGRYPISFMKIRHDMAEKKLVPGWGWVGGFSLKFKDQFKPINRQKKAEIAWNLLSESGLFYEVKC